MCSAEEQFKFQPANDDQQLKFLCRRNCSQHARKNFIPKWNSLACSDPLHNLPIFDNKREWKSICMKFLILEDRYH